MSHYCTDLAPEGDCYRCDVARDEAKRYKSDEALAALRAKLCGESEPALRKALDAKHDCTNPHGNFCDSLVCGSSYALPPSDEPSSTRAPSWTVEDDAMLTVVFTDGRKVVVPIMIPTSGEAITIHENNGVQQVFAEDRSMRCYTFLNVSHWWTEAI